MTTSIRIRASAPWHESPRGAVSVALPTPPAWMYASACSSDPDLHCSDDPAEQEQAKQVCLACPVRTRCLEWALTRREPRNVWGGFTAEERRKIRNSKTVSVPLPVPTARPVAPSASSLVAAHLADNPTTAFTVAQLANAIDRHAWTVDKALRDLTVAGRVRVAGEQPLRYATAGAGPVEPAPSAHTEKGDVLNRVREYVLTRPGVPHAAADVAAALTGLKAKSISGALARLADQGVVTRRSGRSISTDRPAVVFVAPATEGKAA